MSICLRRIRVNLKLHLIRIRLELKYIESSLSKAVSYNSNLIQNRFVT